MNVIYTDFPIPKPYNTTEILRYCKAENSTLEVKSLLNECLSEIDGKYKNSVCYAEFNIKKLENGIDMGFCETKSKSLEKHLKNCEGIILFAATIGIECDRLIAKYNRISPAKALMFQAIGAERIEAVCDAFEEKIKQKYQNKSKMLGVRLSPGYGDIEFEMQKSIFSVLDCQRKIGLTLNESLIMSPAKSVTAIIGIGENYEY
ncbi:MAG: Vitamin B12 dependent methionine synthase activation subunit [Clostridia bacterium]|nr:Vitamin B12 dependent methionine synthase activation subunit [Clostridia bacterium]